MRLTAYNADRFKPGLPEEAASQEPGLEHRVASAEVAFVEAQRKAIARLSRAYQRTPAALIELAPHRERLMLVGELLALRARWLVPRLAGQHSGGIYRIRTGLLEVAWPLADGARWHLVTNLGDRAVETAELPPGQPVYAHGLAPADAAARHALAPGAVLVALETARG